MATSGVSNVILFKAKKEPSDEYEHVLRDFGYQVHFIPVLHFNYINEDLLKDCLQKPQDFSGLIFTSQNAVSAVTHITKTENNISQWNSLPTFVVGQSTSDCVKTKLGLNTIGQTAGNADKLSDMIINYIKTSSCIKPFLFPCGNLRKETLPQKLHEANIALHSLICYETLPHPRLSASINSMILHNGTAVVYFSPSGVHYTLPILQSLVDSSIKLTYCAIGPSTGEALINAGIISPLIALKPTPIDILKLITSEK